MATKRWYLTNSVDPTYGWQLLSETPQTAATLPNGWVVGTGSTFSSEFASGAAGDRASTTFVGNTVPDGTLDTTLKDAWRTENPLNGSFAIVNWTFQPTVVSTVQAGAADGNLVLNYIRADADGSNATQLGASQIGGPAHNNIGTTDNTPTASSHGLGLNRTFVNQYLFIQIAWKRTGAGGMTTTNVRLRTGSAVGVGTQILSSDFTQGIVGANINKATGGSSVADEYPVSEWSGGATTFGNVLGEARGQSFTGNGAILVGCKFHLEKWTAASILTFEARVYATTGSHGTTAAPTGSPLATSDPVTTSVLTDVSFTYTPFTFSGANQIYLQPGTIYCVVVGTTVKGFDPSNLYIGTDSTSHSHAGNYTFGSIISEAWTPSTSQDVIFEVTTVPASLFSPSVAADALPSQDVAFTSTIAAASAVFAMTVAVGAVTITGATIPSSSSLPLPVVIIDQPLVSSHIPSGALLPVPVVAVEQTLVGLFISSGSSVTAPTDVTVSVLAQEVTGVTVTATSGVSVPTVAPGPVTVTGATLTSGSVVRVPTVVPGPVGVTGATIASLALVRVPTVAPGAVTVTGGTRPSTSQVFVAGVTVGPASVSGSTRTTTAQVFAPSVAAVALGATIPPTSGLFSPSVAVSVTTATRGTTVQLFTVTVSPPEQQVTGTTRPTTSQTFIPTVATGAVTVTGAHRSTTLQVFVPTVLGAGALGGATLPSTAQLFVPALTAGVVTVVGATRATTIQVFAPVLTSVALGATIPRTSGLFAPSVAFRVVTAHRSTTVQVFTVSVVAPLATSVTGATILNTVQLIAPSVTAPSIPSTAVGGHTVLSTAQLFGCAVVAVPLPPEQDIGLPRIGRTVQLFAPYEVYWRRASSRILSEGVTVRYLVTAEDVTVIVALETEGVTVRVFDEAEVEMP